MLKVYPVLLRLLPEPDKPTILAWQDRFKNENPAQAAATAKEFVKTLPAHLKPVS
jgi:hypothetical protein